MVPAPPVTRSSHALSLSVLSHPSREARRIVFGFQGFRITPPAPPSQGGERDRSLATSFHRAQPEHASRNRPTGSVNTNFSPAQASPTLGPKGSQDVPRGLITCRFGTQLRWLVSPELARLFQQPDLENHWVPMRNWALPSVMAFVAQATHPAGALLRDRQAAARRGREHGPEH